MKVIIVNFFGITPDEPGATRHYELSSYLQSIDGIDVEFWISGLNYHTDKKKKELKGLWTTLTDSAGIKIVYFGGIKHRNKKVLREGGMAIFSFLAFLRMMRTKADVIVLSMPPVNSCLTWAAKLKHIPLIADVEDLWPLFIEESGVKNKAILKYYDIQANSIYKSAKGIEAVSKGMLDFVLAKIDCSKKVNWVSPLGVNLEIYDNIKQTDNLNKYKWKDDFIIMYIGAHGLANDIISVIDTVEEINKKKITVDGKRASFVFIGDGNYKKEIQQYANNKRLENVFFEEPIRGDLVPFYLKNADACLTNLRRLECFKLVRPNKLFQYMAAAKPIICGIWGESEDIVEEAGAGVNVDFTKPAEAADRITNFLKKEDLESYGIKGNDYIRKKGDRNIIFEEFYKKILEITHGQSIKKSNAK